MRIIKHADDKEVNILYATCCVYFIFGGCFCLKLRSPFSTFAARNRVGRGGKRGECWMEFRLQREAERGNDPARTGAATHGWFRVHLRDKCDDRTGKK